MLTQKHFLVRPQMRAYTHVVVVEIVYTDSTRALEKSAVLAPVLVTHLVTEFTGEQQRR